MVNLSQSNMAVDFLPQLRTEGMGFKYGVLQLDMACAMLLHARELCGDAVLLPWDTLLHYIESDVKVHLLPLKYHPQELLDSKPLLTLVEETLLYDFSNSKRLASQLLDTCVQLLGAIAGDNELDYDLMDPLCTAVNILFREGKE